MSSTDPQQFLTQTRIQADQLSFASHVLAQGEGLVIFSRHISPAQQLLNLQQLLSTLTQKTEEETPPAAPSAVPASSPEECQVTVEERAHLFAFLQGTP